MLDPKSGTFLNGLERVIEKVRVSKLDKTHRTALTVFCLRASSAGLLFIMQVILARWLGATEYGLFVAAWSSVLIVGGFTALGLGIGTMRLVPELIAQNKLAEVRGLLRSSRMIAVTSGIILAMLGGCGVWFISGEENTPLLLAPMMLAFFCLPFYAIADVQDGIGRGQGWVIETITPTYIARPIFLLCLLMLAYRAGYDLSASTAMLAALGAIIISAILQTSLVGWRLTSAVPHGPAIYHVPEWLKISVPLLAVALSELVMQNADVLLLAVFCDPAHIGSYFAAAKTVSLALFIQYAVGSAYGGRIAAASGAKDRLEVEQLTRQAVQATFFPTAAVTLGILTLGYPILMVFGETFTAAYPLMFIMAIGVLARASVGPSDVILSMLGQQKACATAYTIAAVVCILLNSILIPLMGVYGAAIGTVTAIVTAAALNWRSAKANTGLDLFILNQGSVLDAIRRATAAPSPETTAPSAPPTNTH